MYRRAFIMASRLLWMNVCSVCACVRILNGYVTLGDIRTYDFYL